MIKRWIGEGKEQGSAYIQDGRLCLSPICPNLPLAVVEAHLVDSGDVVAAENCEILMRSNLVDQIRCARVVLCTLSPWFSDWKDMMTQWQAHHSMAGKILI